MMDIQTINVPIIIVLGWIASVIAVVLYVTNRFSGLEKKLISYSGDAGVVHENLENRIVAMESHIEGFKGMLEKMDVQATIQTQLLVKMGETTLHIKYLQDGQEEMKKQIDNGLGGLTKRLDEVIAGCLAEDIKKARRI